MTELETYRKPLDELRSKLATVRDGSLLLETVGEIERMQQSLGARRAEYERIVAEPHPFEATLQADDTELLFRRTLETKPALVERITEDPLWLRLIVLLYGGISDEGLATYLVQYDEMAAVLTLENTIRAQYVQYLRQKEYWQTIWDNDDTVYSIAVYLDTDCGAGAKRARQTIPTFKPGAIFSDSPLTPVLLSHLQAGKQPDGLRKELWQKWHRSADALTRAHSLMALLLVDTDAALPIFRQVLTDPTSSAVATLLLAHFRKRLFTLQNPLILLGENTRISEALAPLRNQLLDNQLIDTVRQFYKVYASAMYRPLPVDEALREQFAASSGYVYAECWASWLSGYHGDEDYFGGVISRLETKLNSVEAMNQMGSAYGATFDWLTQWSTEAIPPIHTSVQEAVGDALTVALQSQSRMMTKHIPVSIIEFLGVDADEHEGVQADVLAASLRLTTDNKNMLFNYNRTEIPLTDHVGLIRYLLKTTSTIDNPAVQSRVLWRIGQYAPLVEGVNVMAASTEAARSIIDPLQRSRAFERMVDWVPIKQRKRILTEAEQAAVQIADAPNRARALARIATFLENNEQQRLLTEALHAANTIDDLPQRTDTLVLIQPFITQYPDLNRLYDSICDQLPPGWHKRKAMGMLGLELLKQHAAFGQAAQVTPVLLSGFLADLIKLDDASGTGQNVWRLLLDGPTRPQAVATLLQTVAEPPGLPLTTEACRVIQTLLTTDQLPTIHLLLPYFRNTDKSLTMQLRTWVENRPDTYLWQIAGLLLAEAGQLDEQTLPCLLDIIEHGIDISRYRASMVLHGDIVFNGKPNRRYRASQLGINVLIGLAEAFERFALQSPHLASILSWTWCNIEWDSREIMHTCASRILDDTPSSEAAAYALSKIDLLKEYVMPDFFELLLHDHPVLNKAIVNSWCFQSRKGVEFNIPDVLFEQIDTVLTAAPDDFFAFTRVISDRLATVLEVVTEGEADAIISPANVAVLDERLFAKTVTLLDADLRAIYDGSVYHLDHDPNKAVNAAGAIAETEQRIQLLFAWLANTLKQSVDDEDSFSKCATLLEIAAAVAPLSPAAAFNLIRQHQIETLLTEAAMYQSRFYGRAAAVKLMAYFTDLPDTFISTLRHACQDVAEVQQAAIGMVQNLRYYSPTVVLELIALLVDRNGSVAYSATQLLTTIGRNENTSLQYRTAILSALAAAARQPESARGVWLYEAASSTFYIRSATRLDLAFYKAIIDISGVI